MPKHARSSEWDRVIGNLNNHPSNIQGAYLSFHFAVIFIAHRTFHRFMKHSVTPMHCGTFSLDMDTLAVGVDPGTEVAAPSISYLVEGPSAVEPLLVDTSFGDVDREAERWPELAPRRPPGHTVASQLEARGYTTDDIRTVVLSHLDWDHCGNLDQFEQATVYVQGAELEGRRAALESMAHEPAWTRADLVELDGETELTRGLVAFPTPGHTVGHQSLAVETAEGTTVVAADAVLTFDNLDDRTGEPVTRGVVYHDEDAWWRSAEAVVERADVILPGHEWAILDGTPPNDAPR